MAAQWSGEQDVARYGDLQASSMAVDCLGVWAVLAGRRMLTFVDLQNPKEKVMKNPRQSKWDISCVQWNPHPSHGHLFVTACNQRLDLLSWKDAGMTHQCSMKGHSRTISDVGWSPFDVNVIATCSVDTYINLWDVRDPKKPVGSFQTVAGASQVKWNKVKNNMFATTHEGDVRIWDTRRGTSPLHYITAHPSKIHGLDWCPNSDSSLATSSQDCTVKFWDINNPRQSKGMINPGSPVWRARYTPFGQGIVTVVVPQLRRGDNSLYLWNISHNTAVHQFVGHHDVILEFQWRKLQEDSKDFQLITWSKDQSLRIWKIDPQLQKRCGHDVGDINDSSENESPMPSYDGQSQAETDQADLEFQRQMSMSPDNYPLQQPRTLQQEFDLINTEIPNITVEELDVVRRSCKVTAINRSNLSIGLTMRFPDHYPNNEAPTFEFSDPNMNSNLKQKLLRVLSDTSLKHVKRNTNCLEPCLRQLSGVLELPFSFQLEERRTPETEIMPFPAQQVSNKMSQGPYMPMHSISSSYQDMNIPFPRTSGARFSSAGYLVVFGRAHEAQKGPSGTESTPKALSDLVDYLSKPRLRSSHTHHSNMMKASAYNYQFSRSPPAHMENVSVKEWYYRQQLNYPKKNSWRKQRSKDNSDAKNKENDKLLNLAPVKLYDSSCLLPINKHLGENYKIDTENIPNMCCHNSMVAASVGRKDLVQLWSIISLMADKNLKPSTDPDHETPWGRHPFGRPMLKSMMDFYCKVSDVQTLAMLCCVFWNRQDGIIQKKSEKVQLTPTDFVPPNTEASFTLSSSTDSGWNVLPLASQLADKSGNTSGPPSQMTSPTTLMHSQSHLSEVASHPNLAILTGVARIKRSNSWSGLEDSFEDYRFDDDGNLKEKESERLARQHENYCKMLDPSGKNQYEQYIKAYADILFHWGFCNQSKLVLKYATYGPEPHTGIEFGVRCHSCCNEVRGAHCGTCKSWAFNCVICHTAVKGNSNFCLNCGHGGHTSHLLEWFKVEEDCPTGCGCKCLQGKTSITL